MTSPPSGAQGGSGRRGGRDRGVRAPAGRGVPGGAGAPDVEALRRAVEALEKASPGRGSARAGRRLAPGGDDHEIVLEPPTPLGASVADADRGPWRHGEHGEDDGKPIPVDGGIVATTRRGRIGRTWWSRRFLDALEALLEGGRPARGRSYARRGRVLDLQVRPGVVEARVRGGREQPYRVRLVLRPVPEDDWDRILVALGAHAGYSARMLAGDLPPEVEDVFGASGWSLLPAPDARLSTECTCPGWENPCTHVAAVCYVLAERFDEDPFDLLTWRGRTRADVLLRLREIRGAPPEAAGGPSQAAPPPEPASTHDPAGGARTWVAGDGLAAARAIPRTAEVPDGILRQLPRGVVDVWGQDLSDVLAPLYRRVTVEAARRAHR